MSKDEEIEKLKLKINYLEEEREDFLANWYCDHKGGCLAEELKEENEELQKRFKSEHEINAKTNNNLIKQIEELKERNNHFDNALRGEALISHDRKAQLEKATKIIKNLLGLYFAPVVTNEDLKKQDEIIEQAKQFIKENE